MRAMGKARAAREKRVLNDMVTVVEMSIGRETREAAAKSGWG